MQYPVSPWLTLQKEIADIDYTQMIPIMEQNDLSRYLIAKEQFYAIKDEKGKILAFGRLYKIGPKQRELWSLRVDESQRGKKLWLALSQQLITDKGWNNDIYLATKRALWSYYEKIGFQTIEQDIPEKLIHTGIRAKENGIEFIIMKYGF